MRADVKVSQLRGIGIVVGTVIENEMVTVRDLGIGMREEVETVEDQIGGRVIPGMGGIDIVNVKEADLALLFGMVKGGHLEVQFAHIEDCVDRCLEFEVEEVDIFQHSYQFMNVCFGVNFYFHHG